jgi:hypothetical protein
VDERKVWPGVRRLGKKGKEDVKPQICQSDKTTLDTVWKPYSTSHPTWNITFSIQLF